VNKSMTPTDKHPFKKSLNRFQSLLSEKERKALLNLQHAPLPTGMRLNRLKVDPQAAIQDLSQRYGWQIHPVDFCENAWTISDSEIPPGQTIEHRLGQYYLQDPASMVPAALMDIPVDQRPIVLDMAASPGGKTTHLIDRIQDKGFIIANDASRSRIPALRSVLSHWGGINQIVTQFPGEQMGSWFPEVFDLILLDAPCSMENLRPSPNHPLRGTTSDERIRLQERQIELLNSGLQALKPNGQLVYATCSLAPEEDEAVLDAVLKAYPEAIQIQDLSHRFQIEAPGLTQFKGSRFHPDVIRALRLWPHQTGMSGFFCALIQKTQPIPTRDDAPPQRDFAKTDLTSVENDSANHLTGHLYEQFGFDLEKVLSQYQARLMVRKDKYFLIPRIYLERFRTLPFEMIGLQLGEWTDNYFQPDHAFISRFGHCFTQGIISISDADSKIWVEGRDLRHPQNDIPAKGQYLLVKDSSGRILGLGKLLPKRLRNLLPK
jgi:16S rRNA (cytosine1407-C5)-methyltransferase